MRAGAGRRAGGDRVVAARRCRCCWCWSAVRALAGQVFLPSSRAALPALVARRRPRQAPTPRSGSARTAPRPSARSLAAALLPLARGARGAAGGRRLFVALGAAARQLPALPPTARAGERRRAARRGAGRAWATSGRTAPVRIIALGFCAVVARNGIDDVALVVLATDDLRGRRVRRWRYCSAASASACSPGTRCWPAVGRGSRWPGCWSPASPSAASATCSPAWPGRSPPRSRCRPCAGSASPRWTSRATPSCSGSSPTSLLGRVFGNLYGAIGVAAALSYVGGGVLLDATSAPFTFVAAGTAGALVTVAVALTLPRRCAR